MRRWKVLEKQTKKNRVNVLSGKVNYFLETNWNITLHKLYDLLVSMAGKTCCREGQFVVHNDFAKVAGSFNADLFIEILEF